MRAGATKKRKIPAFVMKILISIALILVSTIILYPFIAALVIHDSSAVVEYYKYVFIIAIGGVIIIFALCFVLNAKIGFEEEKRTPLSYSVHPESKEWFVKEIHSRLHEKGYMLKEESESIAIFWKKTKKSFDTFASVFVTEYPDSSFFDQMDLSLDRLIKNARLSKAMGLIIIIVCDETTKELKEFLETETLQNLDWSSVASAVVAGEGKIFISDAKDVFAVLRYKYLQKEVKEFLS